MLQYKKLTETEIIELAKNNDFKALEELIRRNQKNVFATFSFLVKKRENIQKKPPVDSEYFMIFKKVEMKFLYTVDFLKK